MLWSPVSLVGLKEEHLFFRAVTFSPAPHPRYKLGENKWKVTVSGVLNEVPPVLPSFLRNFREQVSLKPTTHRRLGGSAAGASSKRMASC